MGNPTIVQPWLQNGVPSLNGKMFLGGAFTLMLDIMSAAFNPTWANFIPGFPGPGASEVPLGLLSCLPVYIWLRVGAAILGCSILGKLRQAFPRMGTIATYSFVQLVYMAIFFSLATFWNRTQVYIYVSLPRRLALWYGETYQLPLMSRS